jgi:hypothetical protein
VWVLAPLWGTLGPGIIALLIAFTYVFIRYPKNKKPAEAGYRSGIEKRFDFFRSLTR